MMYNSLILIFGSFKGGVYTEGDVAMTAFVVSTLAECKCKGVVRHRHH